MNNNDFRRYILEEKKLEKNTANNYCGKGVELLNFFFRESDPDCKDIFCYNSSGELKKLYASISKNEKFKNINRKDHYRYSSTFKMLLQYYLFYGK